MYWRFFAVSFGWKTTVVFFHSICISSQERKYKTRSFAFSWVWGGFPLGIGGRGGLSQEWKDIFDAARKYICAVYALQSAEHPWENWQSCLFVIVVTARAWVALFLLSFHCAGIGRMSISCRQKKAKLPRKKRNLYISTETLGENWSFGPCDVR